MAIGANSINETFSGLNNGDVNGQGSYAHASAWSTAGTGVSCSAEVISKTYLRLSDNNASQKVVAGFSLDSGYQSESGYLTFQYNTQSGSGSSYCALQSSSNENDTICAIGMDDATQQIRGYDGSTWYNLVSFSYDHNHFIEMRFDVEAGTVSFRVDFVSRGTKSLVGSTDAVTHIVWRTVTADTNTDVFIDTIVFEGDELEDPFLIAEDTLSMVEAFTLEVIPALPVIVSEATSMVELLTMIKITPLATNEEKLLAGKTDTKLYEFGAGTATGVYDTPDLDFGQPGMAKTLDLVAVTSSAAAPHTVSLYVSVDGGAIYTRISAFVVQTGITGYFYPWITGEKFRLRFQGAGMYLDTIRAQAIPRGKDIIEI